MAGGTPGSLTKIGTGTQILSGGGGGGGKHLFRRHHGLGGQALRQRWAWWGASSGTGSGAVTVNGGQLAGSGVIGGARRARRA